MKQPNETERVAKAVSVSEGGVFSNESGFRWDVQGLGIRGTRIA